MGQKRLIAGVMLVGLLALAACDRTAPIYNVADRPVPTDAQKKLSEAQVGKIIARALISKGWHIDERAPGVFHCSMHWMGHDAFIKLTYSKSSYDITLVRSQNLLQENGVIHHNYNSRIEQLRTEIDQQLAEASVD